MKYFVPFCFLLIWTAGISQQQADTIFREPVEVLIFKVHYPPAGENDIDWSREKPICEFVLEGDSPLTYRFQLVNDTIAQLDRFEDDRWLIQEDMKYDVGFFYRDGDELISAFRVTDFDHDGDEDLSCWLYSNMNGNEWTIVFLNDQAGKKLVRLYDTADDTDIWDRPRHDPATGIIHCTLDGSVYSTSSESTYKLENLTAIPLEKHYQDRTSGRYFEDFYYVGDKSKWKLKKKEKTRG